MKKRFCFAAAIAAVVFTACTEDEYLIENGAQQSASGEITFAGSNQLLTRANDLPGADAAAALGNHFVVVGCKNTSSSSAIVFDNYHVYYSAGSTSTSNTKGWEYVDKSTSDGYNAPYLLNGSSPSTQTIKYWDYSTTSYSFFAYSLGNDASKYAAVTVSPNAGDVTSTALENVYYEFSGTSDSLGHVYVASVVNRAQTSYGTTAVELNFRHISPKVRMAIYETVPGYSVRNVVFYSQDKASTTVSDKSSLSQKAIFYTDVDYFYSTEADANSAPKYRVTLSNNTKGENVFVVDDVCGTDNAYNPTRTKQQIIGAFYSSADLLEESQLIINTSSPNSATAIATDASTATLGSTGASVTPYRYVFPKPEYVDASRQGPAALDAKPLTIMVDYDLVSTDASQEIIHVTKATATVPAAYCNWEKNTAYTYIFKISQKTNGNTGDPAKDDPGLTAITFDACVTGYDIKQTITTVSNTTITTEGKWEGVEATDQDEYLCGTTITAKVWDATLNNNTGGTPTLSASNTNLYIATLTKGGDDAKTSPTTSINEKTVAELLATEGMSEGGTLTDNNGWELTVAKVTSETPNFSTGSLVWTAADKETYYVIEYTNGTNKTYKVVHVKPMTLTVTVADGTNNQNSVSNSSRSCSITIKWTGAEGLTVKSVDVLKIDSEKASNYSASSTEPSNSEDVTSYSGELSSTSSTATSVIYTFTVTNEGSFEEASYFAKVTYTISSKEFTIYKYFNVPE